MLCYCIFASFMCLFPNNKDEKKRTIHCRLVFNYKTKPTSHQRVANIQLARQSKEKIQAINGQKKIIYCFNLKNNKVNRRLNLTRFQNCRIVLA